MYSKIGKMLELIYSTDGASDMGNKVGRQTNMGADLTIRKQYGVTSEFLASAVESDGQLRHG